MPQQHLLINFLLHSPEVATVAVRESPNPLDRKRLKKLRILPHSLMWRLSLFNLIKHQLMTNRLQYIVYT